MRRTRNRGRTRGWRKAKSVILLAGDERYTLTLIAWGGRRREGRERGRGDAAAVEFLAERRRGRRIMMRRIRKVSQGVE